MHHRIQWLIPILALLTAATATATPTGFVRVGVTLPHACSNVFTVDDNGVLYYGHATSPFKTRDDGRAASDELWKHDPAAGTSTIFYNAANHVGSYQIKSVSAIAIDTGSSPWTYYIADQDPAGDPWSTGAIWAGHDDNDDGDIDDAGETGLVTDVSAFVYIEGLILDEADGVLYATEAAGLSGSTMVHRLEDIDHSDFFEALEITDYFMAPGDVYAGKLVFDISTTTVIYAVESGGTVHRLVDLNADDDCLDSGEDQVVVDTLAGGYGIAMDPEGDLFVTASNYLTGQHYLYEIDLDAKAVTCIFDDLAPIAGWTGPVIIDTGAVFEPYQSGAVLYAAYSDLLWSDPSEILSYRGAAPETPTLNMAGLALLLGAVSLLILLRR
ncbi:hypothetical protein JW905_12240 [bacterium]|nr:hypothetical protein [candidate division CSSED10-310 bacterium]